jgi:hypothetical protein
MNRVFTLGLVVSLLHVSVELAGDTYPYANQAEMISVFEKQPAQTVNTLIQATMPTEDIAVLQRVLGDLKCIEQTLANKPTKYCISFPELSRHVASSQLLSQKKKYYDSQGKSRLKGAMLSGVGGLVAISLVTTPRMIVLNTAGSAIGALFFWKKAYDSYLKRSICSEIDSVVSHIIKRGSDIK